MGVSLNGGAPKTPQNDHFFSMKNPCLLGKPTILGNPLLACFNTPPDFKPLEDLHGLPIWEDFW